MTTTLSTLLALHHASQAVQQAHDALVSVGLTAAAAHVHRAGDLVALAVGMLVKAEAEKRRAELAEVQS